MIFEEGLKVSMKKFVIGKFPYLLIIILGLVINNYSEIFKKIDQGHYYGKKIDRKAYNFNLKLPSGKTVQLLDFRGSFLLLTFGFTKCNGVCPLNLHRFKNISEGIAAKKIPNVKFAFISFDEIRDTPGEVEAFVEHFKVPNMYGLLSGKMSGKEVATKYNIDIAIDAERVRRDPDFQINHSGFIYLINPRGELSLVYIHQKVTELEIINDIISLNENERGQ